MAENVDEALAGMAKVGAPREPMGESAYTDINYVSATETGRATLMPRGNTQAGDPYAQAKPSRPNLPVDSVYPGRERNGARYSVRVNTVIPTAPEAGSTQASGRLISPSVIRSRQSFDEGNLTSYN